MTAALASSATLTITAKGQVTLRREVLDHLGVRPGDKVEIDLMPEGEVKVRRQPDSSWSELAGMFKGEFPPLTIEEMNQIIADGWAGKIK
jgi:AbrB family looped-hinge helix DNA binding protein